MSGLKGVLLMAYGTPEDLSDVGPYYREILGGREPSPEAVAALTERYQAVGGSTPLLQITRSVAALLEERLNRDGGAAGWRVYVGMKHWHPFIAEAVDRIVADDVDELVALPMAPHYSRMSIAGYRDALEHSLRSAASSIPVRFVESWHANPVFTALIARRIEEGLRGFDTPTDAEVLFTAHSLPARIVDEGDPYPRELAESAAAVADAVGLGSWRIAYQSAAKTGTPWLGPDILESIEQLAGEGRRDVLVVPFGFVCDHLEILFDIDVAAMRTAADHGVRSARIEMPNDSPDFVEALLDLVTTGAGGRTVLLRG
ncbi:MAG: ferrochelatase [Chloroflexota bacterium]|nr:ferrochelatase [Chloroflexota bacterium]MDE2884064.1 ferrochelatase [Chloroflexota bacterium]